VYSTTTRLRKRITARRLSCASLEPSFAAFAVPMAPNPLDDPSPSAVGTITAAPVSSHALVQTPQVAPASLLAPPMAGASTCSSLPPAYSLALQPQDTLASGICDGQPTFDVMARQTAAGYRAAGPLLGGLAGGGAEGIDLPPPARRVLHAQ
jgi:hypothetical protein